GIEERRLAIYRRLFFNNLSSLFGKNFAIARRIVPDSRWDEIIRAFMVEHRPTTPLFPEIGREFIRFLSEHPEHYIDDWPWLAELCHWQFQATSVRNDEADPAAVPADPSADPLRHPPVVNPTLRMAQYRWPVHRIRADRLPEAEQSVVLAIWRCRDDRLGRMQINPVTALLLQMLQENPGLNGLDALKSLAGEIQHPDPDAMLEHGAKLLGNLCERQALLGALAEC
ncbi:MAG: DNA-binding domain-containing protein, partial [Wenzhouxiangellaceae bacterium]